MKNVTCYSRNHRNTMIAALSSSNEGLSLLNDIEHRLRLAGDERKRMEDEGGIPLNRNQNAKVNRYFRASHRIKNLLLIVGYKSSQI